MQHVFCFGKSVNASQKEAILELSLVGEIQFVRKVKYEKRVSGTRNKAVSFVVTWYVSEYV